MVGDSPSPGVRALFLVCVLCVCVCALCGAPAQASSLLIPFAVISLMDRTPLREFDENTTVCFNNVPVSSSGCWLGDDPLQATLPLLMLQLSLIVVFCRAAHSVLRRLGQVEATCQIIVGFLLGPSVAGRITWFRVTLFPERSWIHLITVGQLGYSLFMFLVGVKTDMSLIMKSGRKPVVVGLASIFVPTGLMLLLTYTLSVPVGLRPIIDAMACLRTPFAVVHHTLAELRLLNSVVGRVAMSASFVSYFVFGIALSLYESMTAGTWMGSQLSGVLTFSSLLAMAVLTVFAIRAVTLWMIRKTPPGRPLPERHIVAVLVMAFGCGMMFEVLGYHFSIGMFFVGLGLPSGPPLGTALVQRLEGMVSTLFAPTFLALGGFMANISAVTDKKHLVYMQLFFGFSFLAKFAGVMATALYCRIPLRESFSLSLVMNVRGINELQVLNVLQNAGMPRDRRHPAWEHGYTRPDDRRIHCMYCEHMVSGIHRFSEHLAGLGRDCIACPSIPSHVRSQFVTHVAASSSIAPASSSIVAASSSTVAASSSTVLQPPTELVNVVRAFFVEFDLPPSAAHAPSYVNMIRCVQRHPHAPPPTAAHLQFGIPESQREDDNLWESSSNTEFSGDDD